MYSQEEISAAISKGLANVGEAFRMIFENIKENVSKVINAYSAGIKLADEIINQYPNRRIKHLALHAKKARVRKKNRQRILNEYYKKLEVKE